jgi:hypothetical protein
MLFLSPKFLLGFILVGSSAVQAQSANDTTIAPSMGGANYTLAITSNHTQRDLRTGRALPTCGNGNRGDGRCANGQCCSQVRGNVVAVFLHIHFLKRCRTLIIFVAVSHLVVFHLLPSTDGAERAVLIAVVVEV